MVSERKFHFKKKNPFFRCAGVKEFSVDWSCTQGLDWKIWTTGARVIGQSDSRI